MDFSEEAVESATGYRVDMLLHGIDYVMEVRPAALTSGPMSPDGISRGWGLRSHWQVSIVHLVQIKAFTMPSSAVTGHGSCTLWAPLLLPNGMKARWLQ